MSCQVGYKIVFFSIPPKEGYITSNVNRQELEKLIIVQLLNNSVFSNTIPLRKMSLVEWSIKHSKALSYFIIINDSQLHT